MDEILKENNQSEKSSDQLNTQTDIVYLYHKIEKLTQKVVALETKLNTKLETQSCLIPVLQSNGIQVPEQTIFSSNSSVKSSEVYASFCCDCNSYCDQHILVFISN